MLCATVVVSEDRLAMLQAQVQSLVHHQVLYIDRIKARTTVYVLQNKLEDELKQIQNKFDERKRKMAQEQESFNSEIKKVCK